MGMKHRCLVFQKIGCNTSRLLPTTYKEIAWEMLPDEVIVDQGNQSLASLKKRYKEYKIKFKGKWE